MQFVLVGLAWQHAGSAYAIDHVIDLDLRASEVANDCCRSWENWSRKFVESRLLQLLVHDAATLSVATSSVPLLSWV